MWEYVNRTNAIHDLTKPKTNSNIHEHKKCGIYKLTCNTFKLSYIRQTSHNLKQRYQEHIRHIKQNDILHVLTNNHDHGTINAVMSFLKQITKTSLLIPYEQYYIQSHSYNKELIPEQNTGENNPTYHMIFNPSITSPSAIYTNQYYDTLQPPRPQYWTHSSTYKTAFTDGIYDLPLFHVLRQCTAFLENFQGNILWFYKKR